VRPAGARCDESCTQGRPDIRGHPDTTEADIQSMMAVLYAAGWGYHAIADLAGRSHAEVRGLLIANFPARNEGEDR